METLKLFNITKKEGEKYAPDLPYIVSVSENSARYNYGSYDMGWHQDYDFTVVEELEPTDKNLMAVVLDGFLDGNNGNDYDYLYKNLHDRKETEKRWNNYRAYLGGVVFMKKEFNLKKLIARLNKDIKEKLVDYKKEISENTKRIKRETSHMKKLNLLLSTK